MVSDRNQLFSKFHNFYSKNLYLSVLYYPKKNKSSENSCIRMRIVIYQWQNNYLTISAFIAEDPFC